MQRRIESRVLGLIVGAMLLGLGMDVYGQAGAVDDAGAAGKGDAAAQSSGTGGSTAPELSSADFEKYAMELRESMLLKLRPHGLGLDIKPASFVGAGGRYPWRMNIMTTVFWVGEKPTENNPVPNTKSAWDPNWVVSYGGYDDPDRSARRGYIPANFTPRQNPFYVALPYNDVTEHATKSEAPFVVPWFKEAYHKCGASVCQNRWIEIRNHEGRMCYAQWSDCGPFRTDNWEYVFGNDPPEWNINQGAGLDVSPAVRDFLGLNGMDVTSWRFVDFKDVPPGPWAYYGDNNDFVINARAGTERVASAKPGDGGAPGMAW
jgi:hypothetical protein